MVSNVSIDGFVDGSIDRATFFCVHKRVRIHTYTGVFHTHYAFRRKVGKGHAHVRHSDASRPIERIESKKGGRDALFVVASWIDASTLDGSLDRSIARSLDRSIAQSSTKVRTTDDDAGVDDATTTTTTTRELDRSIETDTVRGRTTTREEG